MPNIKQVIASALGIIVTIIGLILRFLAYDISWPKGSFGFSGPREDTIWAVRQVAYQEVGLVLIIFGLAVIFVTLINWLWMQLPSGEDKTNQG